MTNRLYVAAAFALTWTVILSYLTHVGRVRRRARALLDRASGREIL